MPRTKAFTSSRALNQLVQETPNQILDTLEQVYTMAVQSILDSKPTTEAANTLAKYILGAALSNVKFKGAEFDVLEHLITQPELFEQYFELQKLSNLSASEQAIFLKHHDVARTGGLAKKLISKKLADNRKNFAAAWYYKNQSRFNFQYEAVTALLDEVKKSADTTINPAGNKHLLSQKQAKKFISTVFIKRKK